MELQQSAETYSTDPRADRVRTRAALTSVVVSVVLLGVKFYAYSVTHSTAVLSDALESIVNVFAAGGAAAAVHFASKPPDRNHPYGHGKVEFVSAAFEGGLITFAAVLLVYQAVRSLIAGEPILQLDIGIGIVLGAGAVNAALGLYLLRVGKRHRSPALVADGHHIISDFWTSLGVGIGLVAVQWTGIQALDPLIAAAVAIRLGVTGARLLRHSIGGLMDEEDPEIVKKLVEVMDREHQPGIIRIHSLRAIRSGSFHNVDAHLVVPEYWSVELAHGVSEAYARTVIDCLDFDGEIEFHTDPCRQIYCSGCEVEDCPIRREPFSFRPPFTVEEAVRKDPPTREAARQQWMRVRQQVV
jgi:cation diffusion facilitator family transporter